MKPTILKTRIKNITNAPMFLRWVEPAGLHLAAGEEAVVDGAYPTACKLRVASSCLYDIENQRVEATLITNLPTERPDNALMSEAEDKGQRTARTTRPAVISNEAPKKDERWGTGTIESQKPRPITLPGHEDALGMDAMQRGETPPDGAVIPATMEIFPGGLTVTDEKAREQQADDNPQVQRVPTSVAGDIPAPAKATGRRKMAAT